ncbi:uncharacterized protein [Montipora foliosa]|uniref:uncharacterized protein n=1 Tax=Montipora foliosa TaxID=591990 RepID=UPI0035F122F5
MTSQENIRALFLGYKSLEILLTASVTINICVAWTVVLPKICKVLSKGFNQVHDEDEFGEDSTKKIPFFCRHFATNMIFMPLMPAFGIALLTCTKVLQNPFFEYNSVFSFVFSVALGHYAFKTAEVLTYKSQIIHYKPLLVHHVVAMATLISILVCEQNAITGLVVLFVEGSLVFAEQEREQFRHVIFLREESKRRKIVTVVVFMLAVIVKGIVPISLLAMAFLTSMNDLLKMTYAPLAFFFLSLVFFAAVDLWFFRDALAEISRQFAKFPRLPMIIMPVPRKTTKSTEPATCTAVNHEGLKSLLLAKDGLAGSINITENALWKKDINLSEDTASLESTTPPELKGQLFVDVDLGDN